MTDPTKTRQAAVRKQRLSQALKANLKRRKAAPVTTDTRVKGDHPAKPR